MSMVGKGVYYGIQRVRGGVTPGMVRRAAHMLDQPWPEVRSYVERRLERNYGLSEAEGFEWLAARPIRDKQDYRAEYNEAAASGILRSRETRHTSGSTGRPFEFHRDRQMTAWMDAAMWAVYGWYGIEPGDRMARFWGRPLTGVDALLRWVADRVLCQRRMNAFDVSPDRSKAFFDDLLQWDPKFAYGYPTLLREFVEHLRAAGEDGRLLGLDVVITTGELLDDATRHALTEFFGCPVADEYGCSESGILAFECPAGTPHAIPIAAYPEVSSGDPRPAEVHAAPVVVTDLYGDSMPFVRYRLDDRAEMHPSERCDCGRELPVLNVYTGRVDSFIRMPDGGRVYDAVLAYSVPHGVAQFQVRQTRVDRLEGVIVVGEGFKEAEILDECRTRWQEALGSAIRVEVEAVDQIGRHSSGKRRYFIPMNGETEQGRA